MLSKRTSAVRGSSLVVILALLGAAAASCAQGSEVDVDEGSSGDGGRGSAQQGSSGVGGGGEDCDPIEICDGTDNNCDGQVDEGCDCKPGSTQSCYTGMPSETAGVGTCKAGAQTCADTGKWGACTGQVTPASEACNAKDDDCDGQSDEDLGTQMCGVGACQVVLAACENGAAPPCEPLAPSMELCDGLDNNCNQLVDESYPEKDKACMSGGQGVCSNGKLSCMNGALECVQTGMPSNEVCDNLDNDCNGVVDDAPGTGGACSTGQIGTCSEGVIGCLNGAIDCVPKIQPIAEACDGMDNNCDGQIDNGIPPSGNCQTGQAGPCAAGSFTCVNGAMTCTPNALASPEQCNNVDDNCNGQVDEGNPGAGSACAVPGKQGPCANGTTACSGGSTVCNQNIQPGAEVCGNGVDEDCNGVADNGCSSGCAHDLCVIGGPLMSGCDPCVTLVCGFDSFCCTTGWDDGCIFEAEFFCGITC